MSPINFKRINEKRQKGNQKKKKNPISEPLIDCLRDFMCNLKLITEKTNLR